ncbi:ribonuclease Z [Gilvibacter sediminis]|uniref:ribonuclease Z n=1 Tax=Gilvibacter sediminis TaxID=379071 RepID=UPI002350AB92|nr:ribonuclease Z [Gilvibacter sediminis]MDC7997747.1 ribonuclease Z [Gilvibacter sediminis]
MKLTILGCYSATPRTRTHPTAQVLEVRGRHFLIDCGEGTQVQLRRSKIKFTRVQTIFISHLHGDHYFGLIGLISTFQLLGRKTPLTIYAPKGLKEVISMQLRLGNSWPQFELKFVELKSKSSELIYEDEQLTVHTIPLNHRIYTNGFLFREKPGPLKLLVEEAKEAGIDQAYYRKLKAGQDVYNEAGVLIDHKTVTTAGASPRSYAYCSDTAYEPTIVPLISGVDTLYHESTFLEEQAHLCESTKHSTARQAAQIAKSAEVNRLILGHYSTRYDGLDSFQQEAKTIFENTDLAEDLKEFSW